MAHFLKALAVFGAWLSVIVVLSLAPVHGMIPYPLRLLTFFAGQLLFPYDQVIRSESVSSGFVFSQVTGVMFSVIQWVAVAALFALFNRHSRITTMLVRAPITIFVTTIVTHLLLWSFGLRVELDGP